jgi:hypothetical protein
MNEVPDAVKKQLPPGRFRTFEEIQSIILEFEEVLRSLKLEIVPGSDATNSRLEEACLAGLMMYMAKNRQTWVSEHRDIRPDVINVCALWQFAERVNRLKNTRFLQQLKPHLELMAKGDFAQNRKSSQQDQASNKLFELLTALAVYDIGSNTTLDGPEGSGTSSPDVMTVLLKQRWGWECKTVNGSAIKSIYDLIAKGVDQIEASADTGIVVLNLKNLIDHERFFPILNSEDYRKGAEPIFGAFVDVDAATTILRNQVDGIREGLMNEIGVQEFASTFQGKKTIPAVLLVSQTVLGVASVVGPIPSLLTVLSIIPISPLSPEQSLVVNAFNASIHDQPVPR